MPADIQKYDSYWLSEYMCKLLVTEHLKKKLLGHNSLKIQGLSSEFLAADNKNIIRIL